MQIKWLTLLLVAIVVGGSAYAQAPDAVVMSVKGGAVVRDAETGKTRPLNKGDKLFAGQRVICAGNCKELIVSWCKVGVPIPLGSQGKTVYSINCGALEGVRAGGPKGEVVALISPKESELVRSETFNIRWKPAQTRLKLTLRVYLGETIWGPEQVEGGAGSFISPSLVAALQKAQKASALHLQLILDEGNGQPRKVKFDLISEANERIVRDRLLVFAEETDGVLKALGRAMVLGEYELYGEAVEELDRALAISQSPGADKRNLIELKKVAIMANYKAYNDERVRQLCRSSGLSASRLPTACSNVSR
jgi:hypothetical protein